MKNIDWSDAPEWATVMLGPRVGRGFIVFAESFSDGSRYITMDGNSGHLAMDGSHNWMLLTERPALPVPERRDVPAWKDECLPPVGTICEFFCPDMDDGTDWHKELRSGMQVEIVGHFNNGDIPVAAFVFDLPRGRGRQVDQAIAGLFRPIRTPEQIAAEEREKAVQDMLSRFAIYDIPRVPWENLFKQMYDAGCRMPKGGDV